MSAYSALTPGALIGLCSACARQITALPGQLVLHCCLVDGRTRSLPNIPTRSFRVNLPQPTQPPS